MRAAHGTAVAELHREGVTSSAHLAALEPSLTYVPSGNGEESADRLAQCAPSLREFWAARRELATIHRYAQANRAGPWAVLGAVLARTATAVPPTVQLPGRASLNLFAALVGPPGGGKDTARRTAAGVLPVMVETAGVGSGEGIAHLFAERSRNGHLERTLNAVLLDIGEIETLAAVAGRNSATILPELRKAYMGEPLGFQYADSRRRLPIPAHTYRLALTAGVQPRRATVLLQDADGGTPQRFIWLPVTDPSAPVSQPDMPRPLRWAGLPWGHLGDPTVMPVCERARREIDAAALARLRGGADPATGHDLLARLKVAAALALLRELTAAPRDCPDVTEDDWALAGTVMDVSIGQREAVITAVAAVAEQANEARGRDEARRAQIVAEGTEERGIRRACQVLMRRLDAARGEPVGAGDLRKALRSDQRGWFGEAAARLIATGQAETLSTERDESGHGGKGVQYRASR
jgi:hypothetical protein